MGERDDLALPPGYPAQAVWVPPGPTTGEILAGTAAGIGAILAAPLLRSPRLRALGMLGPERAGGRGRSGAAPGRPAPGGGQAPGGGEAPAGRVPVGGRPASSGTGAGDPGWFGPDSVAWRVHADTALFVAGVTAFALQSLHPLALAGVADHSAFVEDFFGRTRRTGEFVSGVVFGTSAEAQARVEEVHRVHEPVIGVAPDGRLYSANDPELLEWVHVTEYLAIAAAHRRFGLRPLDRGELDRYVAEVAIVGEAMGIAEPPRTWAELDLAFQRLRPQLAVGEQTRAAMHILRDPPGLSRAGRRSWALLWAGAMACLPPTAARLYGLTPPHGAELVACRSLLRALAGALGPPPPLVAARRRLGLDPRPV